MTTETYLHLGLTIITLICIVLLLWDLRRIKKEWNESAEIWWNNNETDQGGDPVTSPI